MPLASLLGYLAPIMYGARCWWSACHRDHTYIELDPIG